MSGPLDAHSRSASPDVDVVTQTLVSSLIFASRDLAQTRLDIRTSMPARFSVSAAVACRECGIQFVGGKLHHLPSCRTGRVLNILARICDAQETSQFTGKETLPPETSAKPGLGAAPVDPQAEAIAYEQFVRRVMACFDFCEGVSTEELESQRPLKDPMAPIDRQIAAGRVLTMGVPR